MSKVDQLVVLDRTLTLLKRGWTQGVSARDKHGEPCLGGDQEATQWCLMGAISTATYRMAALHLDEEPLRQTLREAIPRWFRVYQWWHNITANRAKDWRYRSLVYFNDAPVMRKRFVLRLVKRAIRKLERELRYECALG